MNQPTPRSQEAARPSNERRDAVDATADGASDAHGDGLKPAGTIVSRSADPGQSSFGGFSGEGGPGQDARTQPKAYERDDGSLRDGIRERLRALDDVDVSELSVQVSEGRVSLHGSIADAAARHAVEDCVSQVLGVRGVDNRLQLREH